MHTSQKLSGGDTKKKLAEMQSCGFSGNACMSEAHQQVVPHTSQAIVITPVLPIE